MWSRIVARSNTQYFPILYAAALMPKFGVRAHGSGATSAGERSSTPLGQNLQAVQRQGRGAMSETCQGARVPDRWPIKRGFRVCRAAARRCGPYVRPRPSRRVSPWTSRPTPCRGCGQARRRPAACSP